MVDQIMDTRIGIETQPLTRINVLVVDDRPDGLLALEAVLSCDRYDLFKASSGQEALQYALFKDFAVILLDVQMPQLDGFETAKLLRENYRSQHTPIIFVTAINKEIRHINQGYENGAVDYIFKPFDPFILKSKVNIFVDLFEEFAD
jgi:DNA-binding response OmpR family regulator